MGREMRELVPVAFLPEDHALAIAAMSYNGKLDFGLLGDYDAMPDLEELAGFFAESLAELSMPPSARPSLRDARSPRRARRRRRAKPAAQRRSRAKPRAKGASTQKRAT